MKKHEEEQEIKHNPSKQRTGKSLGLCVHCGTQYPLKRKTKHPKGIAVKNGCCGACNKKFMEKKNAIKSAKALE
jgi:hypothetical protein